MDLSSLESSTCTPETCVVEGGSLGASESYVEIKTTTSALALYQTVNIDESNQGLELYATSWVSTENSQPNEDVDVKMRLRFFDQELNNEAVVATNAFTSSAVPLSNNEMRFIRINAVVPEGTHHVDLEILLNAPNTLYRIRDVNAFGSSEYWVPIW